MLTEREEKLIKRYCIYPKLAMTGVIMALALGVPYVLLEMIDDLAFHNDRAVFWGLYVYIGFVILYMVLFCWCALAPRFGMRREEWRELQRRADVRQSQTDYSGAVAGAMGMSAAGRLMRKSENKAVRGVGAAAQVAGAVGAISTAGAMLFELRRNAEAMAEAYRVQIPDTKRVRLVMVLLPILAMIGTFVPQYAAAAAANREAADRVSVNIRQVVDALDPVCEYISADDPHERYQSYGYRVAGYLRGMNTDTERCYVYVSLDSQGTVESVSYDAYIDMTISPEENLSRIEKDFEVLNRALKRADVPTEFPDLLSHYRFSEEFKTAFMAGSYYEGLRMTDRSSDLRVTCCFETESEEEFDEYTRPYIYLYVWG